jgi:hypothetical protein
MATTCALSTAASAQTPDALVDAFKGSWETYEPRFSTKDGRCRLELLAEPRETNGQKLTFENCSGPLGNVTGWAIAGSQLALVSDDGTILSRLGGNQQRVSGPTVAGSTLVLERVRPSTAQGAETTQAGQAANDCIFYGYTAACSSSEDQRRPDRSANSGSTVTADVLVKLNMRSEARPSAPVVAQVPANTCVPVQECTTASDGNWCRVQVTNLAGWVRQSATRQNQWPVLTYRAGCN